MIRVFPRRNGWTPTDALAFSGKEGAWPPLELPEEQPVRVSVTFTEDINLGLRLYRAWANLYADVQVGGPAFDDKGGEFVPGQFLKEGVVITSRGCIRKCPFCVVPKREGKIRELPICDGWIIQDNNLLACSRSHIEAVFEMLRRQPYSVQFPGGLDARLIKPWHIELLKSVRLHSFFTACDNQKELRSLTLAANLLTDIPQNKKRCYVLIGFDNETLIEAEKRLRAVFELGFLPFAMLFDKESKSYEWRHLQRTWARPAAYKSLMSKEK